jgi:hypothetical protein
MNMKPRKTLVVALALALTAGVSTAAYAYLTSQGQTATSATTGTTSPFIVSAAADTAGDLVPVSTIGSGISDTINFTVTNPGLGNEELNSISISVGNSTGSSPSTTETNWTSTSGANPACDSSDFSVGGQAVGDGATPGSGAYTISPAVTLTPGAVYHDSFTLQMVDNGANQDSCEGIPVPLYIAAS